MNLPKRNEKHQYKFKTSTGQIIKYTPWLVKDEQEYLYATEGLTDKNIILDHIEELVSKCIPEGFNLSSLSEIDFYRLCIELRKKSKGSEHEIIFTCPHCGLVNENCIIDLDKDVKYTEFSNDPITINEITFNLKDISRSELKKIEKIKNKTKSRFMYIVYSISSLIINDEVYSNITSEDVQKYLEEELTSPEFKQLSKEFVDKVGDIGVYKTFTCDKCKKTTSVYVEDIIDFFG